jgi:RecA DNA recombination protein
LRAGQPAQIFSAFEVRMFPVPLNVSNASNPPFLPVGFQACPERSLRDKKAALLKHIARSERLVTVLPASRLEVRPRPEMLSTGIAEVDATTGGIPRGCLTEICGPASSGKTSVLVATIAAATRREETCVLVDASDSFDPASGQAAGVDFSKLLWVRCGQLSHKVRAGTPVSLTSFMAERASSPALKLEQVLKTTDLILQSGGFGLVALDLAGIPGQFVRRIPLVSWFRFQRAVEHKKTALLVVSEFPCAQACAALVMKLSIHKPSALSHPPPENSAHAQVLEGMRIEAEVVRSRLERKPVQSVTAVFRTQAVRVG